MTTTTSLRSSSPKVVPADRDDTRRRRVLCPFTTSVGADDARERSHPRPSGPRRLGRPGALRQVKSPEPPSERALRDRRPLRAAQLSARTTDGEPQGQAISARHRPDPLRRRDVEERQSGSPTPRSTTGPGGPGGGGRQPWGLVSPTTYQGHRDRHNAHARRDRPARPSGTVRDVAATKRGRVRIHTADVQPGNIASLMEQPDIDGALVGGASLDADDFARIVRYR